MSALGSGAACGVVLGICFVLLGQQFGYLSLSALIPAIEYILIGGVIAGIVGALIGWGLGKRYVARYNAQQAISGNSGSPPS